MGVRGLHTFIAKNERIFIERSLLRDTKLVIDGNALQRVVFEKSERHKQYADYGGNYVEFAKSVRQFMDALKRCKIEPIIVLSGGKNPKIRVRDGKYLNCALIAFIVLLIVGVI